MEKTLNLVKNDPWLEPFASAITGRHQHVLDKEAELTNKGKQTLSDFASGYLYFGLHRTDKGWTFREWAPNATHIYMVGTFNNWEEKAAYKLKKQKNGIWEINLPADAIHHGDLYKLNVYWEGGQGERILRGLHVWYRMNRPKYSVHKSGLRRTPINSRRKHLSPTRIRC